MKHMKSRKTTIIALLLMLVFMAVFVYAMHGYIVHEYPLFFTAISSLLGAIGMLFLLISQRLKQD